MSQQQRLLKALNVDGQILIKRQEHKYLVVGEAGNQYAVTILDDTCTCTCPDYKFRKTTCKHILYCSLKRNSEKLVCPYGIHCTRLNLEHKMQFVHPNPSSMDTSS